MSPGVLAGMWKEAEKKTKQLEERIKVILKERGVRSFSVMRVGVLVVLIGADFAFQRICTFPRVFWPICGKMGGNAPFRLRTN